MKLTIGKGLLRIFMVFYVGWIIYIPIKDYRDYAGSRDVYIKFWENDKARWEEFARVAKEEGDEKSYLENLSLAQNSETQLKETLERWKQANIDDIGDTLAIMFVMPFVYGIPVAIIYFLLGFILEGFVSQKKPTKRNLQKK